VSGSSVNGDGGPPVAVLVGEMDEQGVCVVLDAQTMPRVGLLVQAADGLIVDAFLRDKGRPPSSSRWRVR